LGGQSRDGSTATWQIPEDCSEAVGKADGFRPEGVDEVEEGLSANINQQIVPQAFSDP
jgi:hypothetical protein